MSSRIVELQAGKGLVGEAPSQGARWAYIVQSLTDKIIDGTYPAGSKLPSEAELGKEFGVSRPTVQRAMQDMAARGMVKREHGIGSFVRLADPGLRPSRPFVALLEEIFPDPQIVELGITQAPQAVAGRLRLKGARNVHMRRFLTDADSDRPELVTFWTRPGVAEKSGLDRPGPLMAPVQRLLAGAGLHAFRVIERVSARTADEDEAVLLKLGEDPAALAISGVVRNLEEEPLIAIDLVLAGSLHELLDSYVI